MLSNIEIGTEQAALQKLQNMNAAYERQGVTVPKTFLDLAERMRTAQDAVQDWRATNLLAKQEAAAKLEKQFDAALRRIKKEQGAEP